VVKKDKEIRYFDVIVQGDYTFQSVPEDKLSQIIEDLVAGGYDTKDIRLLVEVPFRKVARYVVGYVVD
jgi:hypothetical protein